MDEKKHKNHNPKKEMFQVQMKLANQSRVVNVAYSVLSSKLGSHFHSQVLASFCRLELQMLDVTLKKVELKYPLLVFLLSVAFVHLIFFSNFFETPVDEYPRLMKLKC